MTTIALPSPKSRLYLPIINFLKENSIHLPPLRDRLYLSCGIHTIIFSRGWDIPTLIQSKIVDIGVTGFDVVCELAPELEVCEHWNVRKSRIIIANSLGNNLKSGGIIITEYPNLTSIYLNRKGVTAKLIFIRGAAESFKIVKNVSAIVTLTSSGNTLRKNNLIELDTLMETDACLVSLNTQENPSRIFWEILRNISDTYNK